VSSGAFYQAKPSKDCQKIMEFHANFFSANASGRKSLNPKVRMILYCLGYFKKLTGTFSGTLKFTDGTLVCK